MGWVAWIAVVAGVLALAALIVALVVWTRQRELNRHIGNPDTTSPRANELSRDARASGQVVAYVANPSKPEVVALREAVLRAAREHDRPEPMWFETTIADPGVGQTRAALAAGADLVVVVGGNRPATSVGSVPGPAAGPSSRSGGGHAHDERAGVDPGRHLGHLPDDVAVHLHPLARGHDDADLPGARVVLSLIHI